VAVEKLHFPQKSGNCGDRKCLAKLGTSLVGLPNAKFFDQFPMKEFFNSHAILRQLTRRRHQRVAHAMAFDAGLGKVVLFGGFLGTVFRFGDTWEWDGTTWSQPATTGPHARAYTTSVYSAAKHRTVLFGGVGTPSPEDRRKQRPAPHHSA